MRQRTQRLATAQSGFTIVELLVATAVTAVLIGLMVSMTSGILTAWNRTSGTLSANNQAKMVLDQVAQDLQGAIFRHDPGTPKPVYLAVEILDRMEGHTPAVLENQRGWVIPPEPQSVILKPEALEDARSFDLEAPDLADCRYGLGGTWLRLFSNSLYGGGGSSSTVPAAISYQIVRRHVTDSTSTPNPAEIRYMLYRTEVKEADRLLDDGYDLGTASSAHYANDELLNPGNTDIIANNVIDFGVRLYVRSAGALDPIFPVDSSYDFYDDHTQYLADGSPLSPGNTRGPFPDVADIMVRILTEEGARQIQNMEKDRTFQNLTDPEKHEMWWNIAEAHSRVFTRRIYLPTQSY